MTTPHKRHVQPLLACAFRKTTEMVQEGSLP